MLKPSNFLYVPIKNGYWLRDSQGKPRMYKSVNDVEFIYQTLNELNRR